MKKSFLCMLLLSFCLLSGCETTRTNTLTSVNTAIKLKDELSANIEKELSDSNSHISLLNVGDSDVYVAFTYSNDTSFANECTATINAIKSLELLESHDYTIVEIDSSQNIMVRWASSGAYMDNRGSEHITKSDVTLDQLVSFESSSTPESTRSVLTAEDYIQANLRSYVSDYDYTTIDSITINDDAGTTAPDDYIALVNLTWSQKNSQETTEKMLDMYSQDMAARIYKDSSKVQEICIFWNVPYLNASAKWSFERGSDGMYKTDQIFSK